MCVDLASSRWAALSLSPPLPTREARTSSAPSRSQNRKSAGGRRPAGHAEINTSWYLSEREREKVLPRKREKNKKKQINYPVPSPSIKQSNTLQKNQTFGLLLLCPIFKLKSHHCYITQATELVLVLSTGWLSRLNRCLFVLFYSVGHLWSVEVVNISEPNYCSQCYVRDLSDRRRRAPTRSRLRHGLS